MEYIKTEVHAWFNNTNHIYYIFDKDLNGIFITYLTLSRTRFQDSRSMWLDFLEEFEDYDIYFSTPDVGYIKNHSEYYGNFGDRKVYKYVRT